MTDTKTKIIEASIEVFKRFGIPRATMGDIAKQAGLSRQTLYSTLGSKEEIIAEAVAHVIRTNLKTLKTRLADCRSFSEQLDAYLEIDVIEPYDAVQTVPGVKDVWCVSEIAEHKAIEQAEAEHFEFLTQMLIPHTDAIGRGGLSPAQLARYIMFVGFSLRVGPHDRQMLDTLLAGLKSTVLSLVTDRQPDQTKKLP